MKKILIAVIAIFIIAGASLPFVLQRFSQDLLRRAGYPQAAVGGVGLEKSGIALKNIDFGNNFVIGRVYVSANFGDLVGGDYHALAARIEEARINVQLPWGTLPLVGAGMVQPAGNGWQLNSEVTGQAGFMKVAGHLTGDTTKKLHLELTEGRIDAPGFRALRMTGWVEREGNGPPGGQLAAGEVSGQGETFYDVTATFSNNVIVLAGVDRSGKRVDLELRPGAVICNGRPVNVALRRDPSEVLKFGQACAQSQ
jgi:hypothetical protein